MSLSAALSNDLLKLIFNGADIAGVAKNGAAPITNLYVGLYSADPGAAGSQTSNELAYAGYSRVAVSRTSGGWTVVGTTVAAASSIQFPTAPAGAASATHIAVGTAATGTGKVLARQPLDATMVLSAGGTPLVSLSVTFDAGGEGGIPPDPMPDDWVALANSVGTPAWFTYLLGTPSTLSNAGLPTAYQPPSTYFGDNQEETNRTWQIGSWLSDGSFGGSGFPSGNFASSEAHVLYAADDPVQRIGVAGLLSYAISNNVVAWAPEFPWWANGQGLDEVNMMRFKNAGETLQKSVCGARQEGRPGWGVCTMIVYANGFIGNAGSNTGNNKTSVQLPAEMKPTSCSISSGGEFMAVTVWNTAATKGQIVWIALSGTATTDSPGGQDWAFQYPGLQNLGNYTWSKIIGVTDLPFQCPTGISLTNGQARYGGYLPADGGQADGAGNFDLSKQADRDILNTGYRSDRIPAAGLCVVISKEEKKACVIDMSPLFSYYRKKYLTTQSDYNDTTDLGQGADQWPYTFTKAPEQQPTITKTLDLGDKPTAVLAEPLDFNRAWVAMEGGQMITLNWAGDIVGTTTVGANPTCIRPVKEKIGLGGQSYRIYSDISKEVIVTVRGERAVKWVRFNTDNGTIMRTLQDTRMVDPVAAEDTDNHSNEFYMVTIADYSGRKTSNYRYGPTVMQEWQYPPAAPPDGYGMGLDGNAPYEFSNSLALPGAPYDVYSANVP